MIFSDIVPNDSWPWYLVTDESRFFEEKFGVPNLGTAGLSQAQNAVFCHFVEFGSYIFLEVTWNDSLRQFLTSSSGKTHEKKFRDPNLSQMSIRFLLDFPPFSQVWFISYPLNYIE